MSCAVCFYHNSSQECDNCLAYGYPCLNCAEYCLNGSMGPGFSEGKHRVFYEYENPSWDETIYMVNARNWCYGKDIDPDAIKRVIPAPVVSNQEGGEDNDEAENDSENEEVETDVYQGASSPSSLSSSYWRHSDSIPLGFSPNSRRYQYSTSSARDENDEDYEDYASDQNPFSP